MTTLKDVYNLQWMEKSGWRKPWEEAKIHANVKTNFQEVEKKEMIKLRRAAQAQTP